MLLMYGSRPVLEYDSGFLDHGVIFNTTSYKMGFIELKCLMPPNSLGYLTDRDFDIAYANYILGNDNLFVQFFQIIYNLYIGKDVYIIVNNDDWAVNLDQSIFKLIQQRYGVNAVLVNSEEDYIFAKMTMDCDFNKGYGIYNLDIDKERFSYLVETFRINSHGYLPGVALEGFVVPDDE